MFVCLGNICRSPAAEGILQKILKEQGLDKDVLVASSGVGDWHIGELPDPRMRQATEQRGLVLTSHAQLFTNQDFDTYELILAADHEIFKQLNLRAGTPEKEKKIHMFTAYSQKFCDQEVPDPYFGGEDGFFHVLDILEDACNGIVKQFA